jgi:hypothetical protein
MPTLKGGVVDAHASLVAGPDGTFAGLVAVKVKDGAKLGKTVHDLVADALKDLPEANRDKIKLNFDKVGGTSIHRFELPPDALKGKSAEEVFGDPHVYLAFRQDAAMVSVGKEGLTLLKDALAAQTSGPAPVAALDFDLARFAHLLPAPMPEQAKKLFKKEGDGKLRVSLEGGSALTLRVQSSPAALQFLLPVAKKKE